MPTFLTTDIQFKHHSLLIFHYHHSFLSILYITQSMSKSVFRWKFTSSLWYKLKICIHVSCELTLTVTRPMIEWICHPKESFTRWRGRNEKELVLYVSRIGGRFSRWIERRRFERIYPISLEWDIGPNNAADIGCTCLHASKFACSPAFH